jgi:hypothetical protein
MIHERLCSHIIKDARPRRAQTLRHSNLSLCGVCCWNGLAAGRAGGPVVAKSRPPAGQQSAERPSFRTRHSAAIQESAQGSALARCTHSHRRQLSGVPQLVPTMRLVSMHPEQQQNEQRVSAPSQVAPSVLRRAVSAADWIAADLRDDGDIESATQYERIAAELRAHAHARGIRC